MHKGALFVFIVREGSDHSLILRTAIGKSQYKKELEVIKILKRELLMTFSVPENEKVLRSDLLAHCTAFQYGEFSERDLLEKFKNYLLK